jgi:uncharacterized membrane protein YoaK (UPF0700 family)
VLRAVLIRDPAQGPLPALLLLLTAATGVVDAVSILGLGRVFVANMTGNVVFIGFALARVPGFSLLASLAALLGFLVGAWIGGLLVARFASHRGLLLRNSCVAQAVFVLAALVLTIAVDSTPDQAARAAIAALAAAAMGIQNAAARRLAVPDLTTTVLTMTLTGIAADARRGRTPASVRRVLAVGTMLAGAIVGALLVTHTQLAWALALALALFCTVAIAVALASRIEAPWQQG